MQGKSGEIVEILEQKCCDVCYVQEIRWRGTSATILTGKAQRYRLFWEGNSDRIGRVGIRHAEKCVNKVIKLVKICNRVLKLRLFMQNGIATIISAYALQVSLSSEQKAQLCATLL